MIVDYFGRVSWMKCTHHVEVWGKGPATSCQRKISWTTGAEEGQSKLLLEAVRVPSSVEVQNHTLNPALVLWHARFTSFFFPFLFLGNIFAFFEICIDVSSRGLLPHYSLDIMSTSLFLYWIKKNRLYKDVRFIVSIILSQYPNWVCIRVNFN